MIRAHPRSDPQRPGQWVRRFVIHRDRAAEYVELYRSLGYEVRVEPATPDDLDVCMECPLAEDCGDCVVIYTKK